MSFLRCFSTFLLCALYALIIGGEILFTWLDSHGDFFRVEDALVVLIIMLVSPTAMAILEWHRRRKET